MEVQGEEGAFKMNMSEEGASKLAAQLTLALKDYLGEFVDDTLVKYVIVLLGNGRSKDEVKEDLDVFLGDSSHSFVTWLWDHLASNVDQYVQSSGFLNEATKVKPELVEHNGKLDSHQPISDSDLGKSVKSSRRRHNRDWKELVTDDTQPPPLRSSVTNLTQCEEKAHRSAVRAKQSMSPDRPLQRKRSRPDERPRPKRDAPQATIAATRRLLQFAVREAVGTTRPSNPLLEPSRKRLRSVVATSTGNSTEEVHPQRIQSVVRLPNTMATAIRAVAEAAEDVRKVRTCNVFDRLSRGVDESSEVVPAFREPAVLDAEYEDYDQIHEKPHQSYLRASDYSGRYNLNASMMDSNTGLASDSASDNEGYDNVNLSRRVMDVSETSTSRGNKANDSLMVQYSVAQDTDEMMRQLRTNDQEKPNSAANTKHKIVNISVNVNTWKPSHYQPGGEMVEVETKKSTQKSGAGDCHPNVRVTKDNSNPGKSATEPQKEHQKVALSSIPGPYSTGRPLEDADLRTVFVNNVHFAATKDTLSRHFNKFGDVLKVIILTDAATGHPKGSAYVEFMRKEAAESALSLDGTSFMSRIIKVVKKSSAQQEASPVMTWPRITRGSPFAVPRYAQAPFSRVFPGAYRGRPSIKPGARSMQWKRDGIPTSAESSASVSGSVSTPPAGRGLTYIRPDFKSDTNPGAA